MLMLPTSEVSLTFFQCKCPSLTEMPNQELHSLGAKEYKPTAKHGWATKAPHFCWQQAKEGLKSLCPAPNHLYIGVMCPGQDVAAPEPHLPICSMPQCSTCLPALCFGSAEFHQMLPTLIRNTTKNPNSTAHSTQSDLLTLWARIVSN